MYKESYKVTSTFCLWHVARTSLSSFPFSFLCIAFTFLGTPLIARISNMYIIVSKASCAPYKHPKLVVLERIRHKISVKKLIISCCLLVKSLVAQIVGKFGIINLALMNQILFLLCSIRTITGLFHYTYVNLPLG